VPLARDKTRMSPFGTPFSDGVHVGRPNDDAVLHDAEDIGILQGGEVSLRRRATPSVDFSRPQSRSPSPEGRSMGTVALRTAVGWSETLA